jgi:hypothetical protein
MQGNMIRIGFSLLVMVLALPAFGAEGDDERFEGNVEILYRNVDTNGSERKYDEDFDGLDSGVRLSNLEFLWNAGDSKWIDFVHIDAAGLGGDPYERLAFRFGREDTYDLRVSRTEQSYLYDLFQLELDQDGSSWNTERSLTDIGLTVQAGDKVELFFDAQQVERDGTSFFMKNLNRDLFRLETPLDQNVERYSVGARLRLGNASLLFRQTHRELDYGYHNSTTDNPGLSMFDLPTLTQYDWVQQDQGDADLTTLSLSLPIGERVHLAANVFGTLTGEESLESEVRLDATGTSFLGTCSVSGAVCSDTNPCDASIPGNGCVADPFAIAAGTSSSTLETDYLALGADLSVAIAEPLEFHLQVQSLSRETTAVHDRDLDGNGVPDDTEGTINDATPGSATRLDYELDTVTGLFVYEPTSRIRVRAGYRLIDRTVERGGYEYGTNEYRNSDYDSGDDETWILGFRLKPAAWLDLEADYEQAEVDQAFSAVAPTETDRLRFRAAFRPREGTRIDLAFLDHERTNTGADFRRPGDCGPGGDADSGCWNSEIEGSTYSVLLWNRTSEKLDFWLRWAQYDLDRITRIHFNLDTFFATDVGDSVYGVDNTEWSGQLNFSWAAPWRAFLRLRFNESDGASSIVGTNFADTFLVLQDYTDVEGGLTYTFPRGAYLGGRVRSFNYDDGNSLLSYDGQIVSVLAGYRF